MALDDVARVPGRHLHAGLDHEEARRRHPDGGVDVVDQTGRIHHRGHLDRVRDVGPSFDELVPAQTHTRTMVGTDGRPHRADQLEQEPSPIAQRPAVAILTGVGHRGEEPPDDGRVRALELDAVEASLDAAGRDGRVAVHDLGDLGLVDRLRDFTEERVGHRARRPDRQARVHRRRLAAVVVDLREHRHVVRVHGLGDPQVPVEHPRVEAVDELLVGPVGRVCRVLLGDDQAGATLRPRRVVGGVLLGRQAVACVVGEVRAEHDPVLEGDRPEPDR